MSEELRRARRELAAVRRTLQEYERRFASGRPITSELTAAALTAVLNHAVPEALAEAQSLAEQLREAQTRERTAKNTYTALRYEAWRLVQEGIMGTEWPPQALENIINAVEDDDDDDNDWERRNA
jgi:hypothetical protein